MPRVKVFDVVFDLSGLNRLRESVRRGGTISASNPLGKGLFRASNIYKDWLKARYIKFASGGGNWPDTEESTKARKRKRTPGTEGLILRETNDILNSIIVKRVDREYAVGVFERSAHPYTSISVVSLSQLHQLGKSTPTGKKWEHIVSPDGSTRRRMVIEIGKGMKELTAIINKERRGG